MILKKQIKVNKKWDISLSANAEIAYKIRVIKMKFIYLILTIFLVFIQTKITISQTEDVIPNIELNICPFEGCEFGKWVIKDTINVYANEGDTTSIKYSLSYNDTVTAITGNIHYENFGKVLITKSFENFEVNDTVIVLRCTEGEFICYYKGKEFTTNKFWSLNNENKNKYFAKIIEEPQFTWWVKILKNGNKGWLGLKNQNPYCFQVIEKIEGMDSLK